MILPHHANPRGCDFRERQHYPGSTAQRMLSKKTPRMGTRQSRWLRAADVAVWTAPGVHPAKTMAQLSPGIGFGVGAFFVSKP